MATASTAAHWPLASRTLWIIGITTIQLTSAQFTGWEDYISSWQFEAGSDRLFPYGELYHDSALRPPTLGEDTHLQFSVPFYGRTYSNAYIDISGHIEFSNTDPATTTSKGPKTEWPNPLYPREGDPPFMAPYIGKFALTELVNDQGKVYWRALVPGGEMDEVDREIAEGMLDHLSAEVHAHMLDNQDFVAENGLVVTWSDMTFSGCTLDRADCPTNTIQAALVTDGTKTFALYNYFKLSWIGSHGQGYHSEDGVTCPNGDCRPAQAGFNAGKAEAFYHLPYSNTPNVRKLADIGGRFVYGVDSMLIQRGGCTNQTDVEPLDWPLVCSPDHGTMLGGQTVYVSGPCFLPTLTPTVHCKFGDTVVEGALIDGDHVRAACVTPTSLRAGQTQVQLSTDAGTTWPYRGDFHFHMPDSLVPTVSLDQPEHWHQTTPGTLAFTWDPSALDDSYDMDNLNDTDSDLRVDVRLFGYFETVQANQTTGELRELTVLVEDVENSGQYEFSVSDVQCPGGTDCNWGIPLPTGLLEVRRRGSGATPRRLWSTPFPLGWYGNSAWEGGIGADWADQMCTWWWEHETADVTWRADLVPCPALQSQAHADPGQFIMGWDCNLTWPICPKEDAGAERIACYEQVTPHSHKWSSVSHCCYDEAGDLLFAGDSPEVSHASPSAKASSRGDPHGSHGNVPMLSHYCWDKVFQTLCCQWTSDPSFCLYNYMATRPTADVSGYSPPQYTTSYGDPHFRTYDGVEYTFNGRGEYWLLQVHDLDGLDNFNIQARMERPHNHSMGEVQATVMTVVAMQEGYADSMTVPNIEVVMATQPASTNLILLVDSQPRDLTPEHLRWLEIPYEGSRRIFVRNNEVNPHETNRQSNLTAIFPSGITVQVSYNEGALHIVSSLPDMYKGQTSGLFGLWNDNYNDDLRTPNGGSISPDSGTEAIHNQFGEPWVIANSESRFTYRGSLMSIDYHDPDFRPYFEEPDLPPGSSITEADVDDACGENFVCRFDYKTMMSRDLAIASTEMQEWSRQIVNISAPVAVCPYMDVPYSVREVTHYRVGGRLTLLGCAQGYSLQGPREYHCVGHGGNMASWDPTPNSRCAPNKEIQNNNKKKIIMIVVPIVVVVAAVGIAVGIYFICKHRKKKAMADDTAPPRSRPVPSARNSLDVSTLRQNFNPAAIHRPVEEPHLLAKGAQQAETLAGNGALGSLNSFTGSGHIDTRLRSPSPRSFDSSFGPDFSQNSVPIVYSTNPDPEVEERARSQSMSQAQLQNNYNILMASGNPGGYAESDGFSAVMQSQEGEFSDHSANPPGHRNHAFSSNPSLGGSRTTLTLQPSLLDVSQPNINQTTGHTPLQPTRYSSTASLNQHLNQSRQNFHQSQHSLAPSAHSVNLIGQTSVYGGSRASLNRSRASAYDNRALEPDTGHVLSYHTATDTIV